MAAKYFCPNCGASLEQGVKFCANCGQAVTPTQPAPAQPAPAQQAYAPAQQVVHVHTGQPVGGVSPHSRLIAFLLCWFLGYLGIHRFYVGKTGSGVVYLLTLGWLGIGVFIDFFIILFGSFRDSNGLVVSNWDA